MGSNPVRQGYEHAMQQSNMNLRGSQRGRWRRNGGRNNWRGRRDPGFRYQYPNAFYQQNRNSRGDWGRTRGGRGRYQGNFSFTGERNLQNSKACAYCFQWGHDRSNCDLEQQHLNNNACLNCAEIGTHPSKQCPLLHSTDGYADNDEAKEQVQRCGYCTGSGHTRENCPVFQENWENDACLNCGEVGHYSRDCPLLQNNDIG